MWKNIAKPNRPQMTIWRMRVACWITKATNTHSEYVILIAFPQQKLSFRTSSVCGAAIHMAEKLHVPQDLDGRTDELSCIRH